VPAQGTDNVVFRLGGELSVRLPRKPAAVRGLLVERVWFPRLAPRLPLAVLMPVAAGEPSEVDPFPWTVCSWVSGMPLPPGGLGSGDVACWPTSSWRCGRWTRPAGPSSPGIAPGPWPPTTRSRALLASQGETRPSAGASAGDSDEGQRDVVVAASLDRCLP
jgi:hypothetical protein